MAEITDLRYPIGRFSAPVGDTASLRAEQVLALRELPPKLREAVAGLNEAQLDTPYREGGWTVRQVVHHVADSHMNAYGRFKLALTEEWPAIKGYEEAAWAKLADSRLPPAVSLAWIDALHARWVALIDAMSGADFARGYIHPQLGRQRLGDALALYAWHSHHHTAHITSLRRRQGW